MGTARRCLDWQNSTGRQFAAYVGCCHGVFYCAMAAISWAITVGYTSNRYSGRDAGPIWLLVGRWI
jgi:hypothetical protein